jgi:RES domain-containing protein
MANTTRKKTLAKARFVAIPVDIPDSLIISPRRLPRNWKANPPPEEVRQHGAALLQDAAVVRFPSVIVVDEFCYVINPRHPDFRKLKIGEPEPFSFDLRILKSSEEP